MTLPFQQYFFLWLLIATAAISCLVAILACRRHEAAGAKPMAMLMLTNAILAVFYALATEAFLLRNITSFLFWERLVTWFGAVWIFNLFWHHYMIVCLVDVKIPVRCNEFVRCRV